MAANVVQISETNGTVAGQVTTDGITNMNLGSVDTPNLVAASHPVIIASNSFTKWLRFKLVTNNNTSDGNIRFWKSAGAYVTGEQIGSNCSPASNTYNEWTINTYGHNTIQTGNTTVSPMPYNGNGSAIVQGFPWTTFPVSTSQPASENLTIGAALGGTLTANGTYSNYAAVGALTTASTPAGATNTKTFTFTYDEV